MAEGEILMAMWKALGRITVVTSGVPVSMAINIPNNSLPCQTIFVQVLQANTGKVYILDSPNGDKKTNVLATIPAPTLVGGVATFLPYASVTVPNERNMLNPNQLWLDADNSGESVQASAVGFFSPSFGNRV
jgi:hypothetical protein